MYVERGPVLGALVDPGGGPVLYLDLEAGLVKQVDSQVFQPPLDITGEPIRYALISERTGAVGQARYDLVEAALALQAREDRAYYSVVAVVGGAARALNDEERAHISKYGLPT
jgi:hypothetical protein